MRGPHALRRIPLDARPPVLVLGRAGEPAAPLDALFLGRFDPHDSVDEASELRRPLDAVEQRVALNENDVKGGPQFTEATRRGGGHGAVEAGPVCELGPFPRASAVERILLVRRPMLVLLDVCHLQAVDFEALAKAPRERRLA
eukprot:7217798-Prymnesium_polylepis.1